MYHLKQDSKAKINIQNHQCSVNYSLSPLNIRVRGRAYAHTTGTPLILIKYDRNQDISDIFLSPKWNISDPAHPTRMIDTSEILRLLASLCRQINELQERTIREGLSCIR